MINIADFGLIPAKCRSAKIGDRFGRLTVVAFGKKGRRCVHAVCICDCGNYNVPAVANLKRGSSTSCGCFREETRSFRNFHKTHGLSRNRLYQTWHGMMERCYNITHPHYERYGGRGIEVCDRWKTPSGFINDMADSFQEGSTLDRVDNDRNYEPANCRWATPEEQQSNRCNNVYFTHEGETLTIAQWSRKWGITGTSAARRIRKLSQQ